jgi:ssDNA-binding Zn-finger/Zn-ribbon topoisomerase 1
MGLLDEAAFDLLVRGGCPACRGTTLEIRSFLDKSLVVMAGDPNDDGRWVHDGEKFVDGTYHIACASCAHLVFASDACPRCNAVGGLARALAEVSRLVVPKRCPACDELELMALALVPATARHGGGDTRPKPKPLAEHGDPGYHVVAYACDACDRAVVAERCPLCDAPGPLRARP